MGMGSFEVKDEDKIFVIQVYPSDFRINYIEKVFPIKRCCCLDRGNVMVRAQFEKTIYHPGETAAFTMNVDAGEADMSPDDVTGECIMEVEIKCRGHRQTFTKTIDRISHGRLEKGLSSGIIRANPRIEVPIDEMTTLGRLVESEFYLRARAQYGMCCHEDPNASLRILVCGLPKPDLRPNYIKQFNAPPGWAQPQMMPPVMAQLATHANMYPNYYQQAAQGNNQIINPMLMNAPDDVPVTKFGDEANGVNLLMQAIGKNIENKPLHPQEKYQTDYPHAPGDSGIDQGPSGPFGDVKMARLAMEEDIERERQKADRMGDEQVKRTETLKGNQGNMAAPNQPLDDMEYVDNDYEESSSDKEGSDGGRPNMISNQKSFIPQKKL